MSKVLAKNFYDRKTPIVAEELLGKNLVWRIGEKITILPITEVEAYDGFEDKASHAHKGLTERNKVMFGDAGYWYVYLVYGMYCMLNIVTGNKGYPAAILIRGAGDITGPGRLTKALRIGKTLNGKKASRALGLWIEDAGVVVPKKEIKKSPRIGVAYAGPIWAQKKYRFVWRCASDT